MVNPPPQHDIDVPNAEIFIKSKPSPRWGPQSKRRCVILNLSSPDLFILFKTYVIIGLFNISGQLNPNLEYLTRQIMPVSVLKRYIIKKNKVLRPMGAKICVNVRSAYKMHMVPITTSLNSQQDEVLTHITFDTANTTANCKMIIEERIKKNLDDQYKPPPILWTNKEYLLPIAGLYSITIICFTILCAICLRPRPSSGPRGQDLLELANRRD